jgi:hypothetical protein
MNPEIIERTPIEITAVIKTKGGKEAAWLRVQQFVNIGPGFTFPKYRRHGLLTTLFHFLTKELNLKNFYIMAENEDSASFALKEGFVERKDIRVFEKRA